MESYLAKTMRAYTGSGAAAYEASTTDMVSTPEICEFLDLLPAPLQPGAHRVLDAGCAYGRDSGHLRAQGCDVRGVDLSPAFIARAQLLQPDIPFAVEDIRHTNFPGASFDGIWCDATLLHLNDTDMLAALREFHRLLRPGGVLAASLKKGSGTQTVEDAFSTRGERFFNFKTHETFLELLGATGLHEVSWHYVNERERYGPEKRDLDWLYSFSRR